MLPLQLLKSLKGTAHSSKQVFESVCACVRPCGEVWSESVCTCVVRCAQKMCVHLRAYDWVWLLTSLQEPWLDHFPASFWTRHSHLCAHLKEAAGDNSQVNR